MKTLNWFHVKFHGSFLIQLKKEQFAVPLIVLGKLKVKDTQGAWRMRVSKACEEAWCTYFSKLYSNCSRGGFSLSLSINLNYYWEKENSKDRSSRSQMFFKIGVLKNFEKIHRKTPVSESLFK